MIDPDDDSLPYTPTKPTLCPYCGMVGERATEAHGTDTPPSPRDIAICLNCGLAGFYNDDMSIRRMTSEEITSLPPDVLVVLKRAFNHAQQRGPIDDGTSNTQQ